MQLSLCEDGTVGRLLCPWAGRGQINQQSLLGTLACFLIYTENSPDAEDTKLKTVLFLECQEANNGVQ